MSRIGKQPIKIPEGVEISIEKNRIVARGVKGKMEVALFSKLKVQKVDNLITIARKAGDKRTRSMHGLVRSLINNAVLGVSGGFAKELEMVGVGYRAKIEGKKLILSVGYSHPVEIEAPPGVEFKVEKNVNITVCGIDKQQVGEAAARIRGVRPPEPYKGKGIRYKGEVIRRKPGKAAKAVGIGE